MDLNIFINLWHIIFYFVYLNFRGLLTIIRVYIISKYDQKYFHVNSLKHIAILFHICYYFFINCLNFYSNYSAVPINTLLSFYSFIYLMVVHIPAPFEFFVVLIRIEFGMLIVHICISEYFLLALYK